MSVVGGVAMTSSNESSVNQVRQQPGCNLLCRGTAFLEMQLRLWPHRG